MYSGSNEKIPESTKHRHIIHLILETLTIELVIVIMKYFYPVNVLIKPPRCISNIVKTHREREFGPKKFL